jgi:polyhydroxyalkanoic acid synthase PhaR subunit
MPMSQKSEQQPAFDPFGAWKNMRDAGMGAWSKMMIQLVNSEAYAQGSGALLDTWLVSSAPFRTAIESTMTQVLTQLNMPTRSDITGLAGRLTHIEMRLDDLEAKLDERPRSGPKATPGRAQETSG